MIPQLLARTDGWSERAACVGHDPEMWFPQPSDKTMRAEAMRICRGCPVQTACLNDAIETGDTHGVRGATTGTQRQRLAPMKAILQPGICQHCDRRLVPRDTWRGTPSAERDLTTSAERGNHNTCKSCARRKGVAA